MGAALAVLVAGCNLGVPSRFFPMTVEGDLLTDLTLGDLNGDGHVDVVAVGHGRYGVALGDGAGGFTVTQVAAASVHGGRVTLADIDADGRLDQV
ncbi:MAG TPA: VCBS repeat-containing protein [Acidimicrobiales bacterium]|nr:VCBS repeat-containing protein [Acidimicrobiales bacterium]